jgi:hypothetical protein
MLAKNSANLPRNFIAYYSEHYRKNLIEHTKSGTDLFDCGSKHLRRYTRTSFLTLYPERHVPCVDWVGGRRRLLGGAENPRLIREHILRWLAQGRDAGGVKHGLAHPAPALR